MSTEQKYPEIWQLGAYFHQDFYITTKEDHPEILLEIEGIANAARDYLNGYLSNEKHGAALRKEITQVLQECKSDEEIVEAAGLDIMLNDVLDIRRFLEDIIRVLDGKSLFIDDHS